MLITVPLALLWVVDTAGNLRQQEAPPTEAAQEGAGQPLVTPTGPPDAPEERRARPGESHGVSVPPPDVGFARETEVWSADRTLTVIPGRSRVYGEGPVRRYLVEVEEGLPGFPRAFAEAVERTLGDERSWGGEGALSFQRVDEEPVDFRVTLASPELTDELCAPLLTNGEVSCFNGTRSVINQNRWVSGVPHFDGDLETYRVYVINHEVGHALGFGHVNCPGPGELAPVMQQQTYGLQGCEPNGWPFP
ncbi:hypothetical protein FHR81_004389 [Actinoalloteichus hoggarensis]|uniref:DUF3152 domain-containing protein n=1 Tax=Actinoalloteichus hoggarensis TaxID=1470176 RepID=UPI0017C38E38|nr:DUF3152 domain-containing protein [Actinoalloteichus hoggarensis]MBB5923322.1 hypothetical protein [Actinoalloteichus hoggarensis]